jgi:hypothetical protein
MDLREIGWEGVDWKRLAQDCDQWREHGNKALSSRKTGQFLD